MLRDAPGRRVTVDELLGRLDRVKRNGKGWTARCPAHDDQTPSLSVDEGEDGLKLLTCHAGCSVESIVAALGYDLADLFPDRRRGDRDPEATYTYVDERGTPLFDVGRFPGKKFVQRRAGAPAWTGGIKGVRRVLYRLDRVVAGIEAEKTIYVVEGEKDVQRLEREGLVATTAPMGAGKWRPDYTAALLRARQVVVIADHDEPGIAHARRVAADLADAGIACRALLPPTAGHDISDHLRDGLGLDDLVSASADAPEPGDLEDDDPAVTFGEFVARRDETAAEPLVETETQGAMLPAAGAAVFAAKTGDGKTTLTVEFVLHAAAGKEYLGLRFPRPVRVLVVENEGPREAFREKLERKLATWEHEGEPPWIWDEPAAWGAIRISDVGLRRRLRATIEKHRIDLVVSDTLTRFGVRGNGTPEETREFVEWLTELGLGRDVAFLLLHHPRTRSEQGETDLERIAGAWPPHADLILLLQKQAGGRARLSFPKTRWARGERPASILAFDPDTETFTYVADDERPERDYIADLAERMADGEWWTVNSLRKRRDDGGIGADPEAIKQALIDARFESRSGEAIGKRKDATFYRLREASSAPADASETKTAWIQDKQASLISDDASDAPMLGSEKDEAEASSPKREGLGDDASAASFDPHEVERLASLANEAQPPVLPDDAPEFEKAYWARRGRARSS